MRSEHVIPRNEQVRPLHHYIEHLFDSVAVLSVDQRTQVSHVKARPLPRVLLINSRINQGCHKFTFAFLQFDDFMFNGVEGDQTVHADRTFLPDAVRTIHCLFFHGRVPPWIHDEHVVRFRQCQSCPPSLQGDEEHVSVPLAKLLNH